MQTGDGGHTIRLAVTATGTGSTVAQSSPTSAVSLPPAPAATVDPAVTGIATVSQKLSGHARLVVGHVGHVQDRPAVVALRRSGANCVAIAKATASTYTLTTSDAGATIVLRVSATGLGGTTTKETHPTAVVALPPAPSNTALPKVTGTTTAGKTLTVSTGSWTALGGDTVTRQWERCDSSGANCAAITGATKSTYVLTAADATGKIVVHVTATGLGGPTSVDSAATAAIAAAPAPVPGVPTVSGTLTVGKTLTGAHGTWTNVTTYTYAWYRCSDSAGNSCAAIAGATSSTYKLAVADSGNYLVLKVTGTGAWRRADGELVRDREDQLSSRSIAETSSAPRNGLARNSARVLSGSWSTIPPG